MKRKGFIVIMLALCILMCISIVGCGGGNNPGNAYGGGNGGEDESSIFEFALNEDGTYVLVGITCLPVKTMAQTEAFPVPPETILRELRLILKPTRDRPST